MTSALIPLWLSAQNITATFMVRGFTVAGWRTLHKICHTADLFYYRETYKMKINCCASGEKKSHNKKTMLQILQCGVPYCMDILMFGKNYSFIGPDLEGFFLPVSYWWCHNRTGCNYRYCNSECYTLFQPRPLLNKSRPRGLNGLTLNPGLRSACVWPYSCC